MRPAKCGTRACDRRTMSPGGKSALVTSEACDVVEYIFTAVRREIVQPGHRARLRDARPHAPQGHGHSLEYPREARRGRSYELLLQRRFWIVAALRVRATASFAPPVTPHLALLGASGFESRRAHQLFADFLANRPRSEHRVPSHAIRRESTWVYALPMQGQPTTDPRCADCR